MRKTALSFLLSVALAGCSFEPHYQRPEPPVPPSWPVGDSYLRQSEAALPSISYRDVFRDPKLQRLIEQALANNRDLRIAAANIASARALYRVQRARQRRRRQRHQFALLRRRRAQQFRARPVRPRPQPQP